MRVPRGVRVVDRLRSAAGGDVATMSLDEIHRARRTRLPHVPVIDPLVQRAGTWLFGRPRVDVAVDQLQAEGAAGVLPVRRFRPRGVPTDAPLVVYFHGGGWVLGGPAQYDWWCTTVAAEVGAVVASVDYRKAPEHPAPAAVDDAVAATGWLVEHAGEVGATGPVVVAGDSAGGNLAALVAVAARDGRAPAVAGQVLVYPGVDLSMSFPSITRLADAPILDRAAIEAFLGHYLAGGVAGDDPRVSPWFVEDLAGVAPALVQVAEQDPLHDEGLAYAGRLEQAGVPTRTTDYVGMPHGFVSLPGVCPPAHQAVAEAVTSIRRWTGR